MNALTLRRATLDDLPALHRIVNAAYRSPQGYGKSWTGEGHLITGDRITEQSLRAKLEGPIHVTVALLADGTCVGCVEVDPVSDATGVVTIGMLSVDPHQQSAGTGRVLFAAAEDAAWNVFKANTIELWALRKARARLHMVPNQLTLHIVRARLQRDTLIAWYKRLGYVDTGRRERFPVELAVGKPTAEALAEYDGDFSFCVLQKQRPLN